MTRSFQQRRNSIIVNATLMCVCLLCIIPLLTIVTISFSSEKLLVNEGYRLIPQQIDFTAYKYILRNASTIVQAYQVTALVTVCGTIAGVIVTSLLAFALSRSIFIFRKPFSFLVIFTLLFNGGLVPSYILMVNYLHLKDSFLALILPYLIGAMNVLILRTFFRQIPEAISESAKIDGASEWTIYWRIVFPLSKPALATIGLLILLVYWNDWWLSLLYIDSPKLLPLQLMLHRMMANLDFLRTNASNLSGLNTSQLPSESARMAMCVLASAPILLILPFFQKYFVRGLTLGSVKG